MLLLTSLVPKLPQERLHVVLVLVTEAVLGTKEVSEKARNAAYDLLVALGNKMAEGGTISQSLMAGEDGAQDEGKAAEAEAGDDEDMRPAEDGTFASRDCGESADPFSLVTANIEEYIKIVAAGMVGTTPHMISATITALSRLIFEFQGEYLHNVIGLHR
jgi:ribosomal RNA-processing protein 12